MRKGNKMKKNRYKIQIELEDNIEFPEQRARLVDIYRELRGIEHQLYLKIVSINQLTTKKRGE
jgi:hypothetical protein